MSGAGESVDEALALIEERGPCHLAPQSRLLQALLALEKGRAAEAESLAQQSLEELQPIGRPDIQALAHANLAQARLARGDIAAARQSAAEAEHLASEQQSRVVQLRVGLTAARTQAASLEPEDLAAAAGRLEAILAEAQEMGLAGAELEARLALGELELASGRTAAGRARLEALQTEAEDRGFGLIAQKASRALEADPGP